MKKGRGNAFHGLALRFLLRQRVRPANNSMEVPVINFVRIAVGALKTPFLISRYTVFSLIDSMVAASDTVNISFGSGLLAFGGFIRCVKARALRIFAQDAVPSFIELPRTGENPLQEALSIVMGDVRAQSKAVKLRQID